MDAGMDLLQGVQDAQEPVPAPPTDFSDGSQMPSLEQLLEILEGMDMTEDEKSELKASLMNRGNMMNKIPSHFAKRFQEEQLIDPSTQYFVFLIAFAIVACIFVFFGYKLYKSLTEKERRKQEKKKQKQQKKKK